MWCLPLRVGLVWCDVCSVSTQLQWFEQGHIDDMVGEDKWVAFVTIPLVARVSMHVCDDSMIVVP